MCDDKGRVKWLLLRGPGNNGQILDKSKFLLSKVLGKRERDCHRNVTENLCKMDAIGHPHINVSWCIRTLPIQMRPSTSEPICPWGTLWAIVGTGTMQPERNFPERDKGNSGKRFLSRLCYTQPGGRGMPGVRLTMLQIQSHLSLLPSPPKNVGKKGYLGAPCPFPPKHCKKRLPGRPLRPRPSLPQHQSPISVTGSARMSETAPILDTDLQAGWTMLFWPSHDRIRLP